MDDYKQRVLGLYSNLITPTLGDGTLRQNMLSALEMVLNAVPVEKKEEPKEILSKPIDYDALQKISESLGRSHTTTRIANAFDEKGIITYGDLLNSYREQKARTNRSMNFAGYLNHMKNLGSKSAEVLQLHFKLIGLEVE